MVYALASDRKQVNQSWVAGDPVGASRTPSGLGKLLRTLDTGCQGGPLRSFLSVLENLDCGCTHIWRTIGAQIQ